MKRKTIDELFDNLHITLQTKRLKSVYEHDKAYTQNEVDNLLRLQQDFLFNKFKNYVELMRSTNEFNIPKWTF